MGNKIKVIGYTVMVLCCILMASCTRKRLPEPSQREGGRPLEEHQERGLEIL